VGRFELRRQRQLLKPVTLTGLWARVAGEVRAGSNASSDARASLTATGSMSTPCTRSARNRAIGSRTRGASSRAAATRKLPEPHAGSTSFHAGDDGFHPRVASPIRCATSGSGV
jgi:hypothetical protein